VITGDIEGQHLTDMQKPWRRIRKLADLPDVRIHDLRHTFASSGVALGQGLPIIGRLLGHTQPQTTARYAHLAATPALEVADKISESLAAHIQWEDAA
jgi:integrase